MELLKKISIKFQIILVIIAGVIGAMLFFYLKSNLKIKKQLEYQLDIVKKETQLAELEKDEEVKETKIKELKTQEKDLKKKIKILEEKEVKGEELSPEELEKFFDDRGF